MNWSEGTALCPLLLTSPLTFVVHPWSVHCKCTLVSPKNKQMAHNQVYNGQINRSETKSTLVCFTKHAKCMTLSGLEISLPRQRSHDTLALDISA